MMGVRSLFVLSFLMGASACQTAPLHSSPANVLPGTSGKFDFMEFDGVRGRILAAHGGAGTLLVFDVKNRSVVAEVPVGFGQGVAIDEKGNHYFVGDKVGKRIVVLNAETLAVTARISVPGPVDAIAFDSKRGVVYADEDDGTRVWVVDPKQKKIIATISISGKPEVVQYDAGTDRIYQAIQSKNEIAVIDPVKYTVEKTWSTLPAESPHGLVLDPIRGEVFTAGSNGVLVALDLKTGKLASSVSIAPSPDQIAFDRTTQTIYTASRGFISAVQNQLEGLRSLGNVESPKGAHTLAVDSVHGEVWVVFGDANTSSIQSYRVGP
jgi:DNA-binding beta-propeller fold protein YncE